MKKILVLLTLVGSIAMAQGNIYEFRAGWDLYNRAKDSDKEYQIRKDVLKTGPEVSFEYRKEVTDNLELGGGLAYKYNDLTARKVDVNENKVSVSMKGLHSVPIYATAKYNFKNDSAVTPYVKAKLGFAVNSGKIDFQKINTPGIDETAQMKFKHGFYYGAGAGVEYNNFVADLSYNVNTLRAKYNYSYNNLLGTKKESSSKETLNHGMLTLSVGYALKN